MMKKKPQTSWQKSSSWYNKLVGKEGHYYHKTVVIPGVLHLLNIPNTQPFSVLDLACGQGILARQLPKNVNYTGIDAAKDLIESAKEQTRSGEFIIGDVTEPLEIKKNDFDAICCLLAIQNIHDLQAVFKQVSKHLKKNGKCILVLNHPCFRIPRQSSWHVNVDHKKRSRLIDSYMSEMEIPISMQPGKGKDSETTLSYHRPLSTYIQALAKEGLTLVGMEEWCSDKKSTGKYAKMENRSRSEIPLFMALVAVKPGN